MTDKLISCVTVNYKSGSTTQFRNAEIIGILTEHPILKIRGLNMADQTTMYYISLNEVISYSSENTPESRLLNAEANWIQF